MTRTEPVRSPLVGDIVHVVLSTGAHRPAIVIQPFSRAIVALQVFSFPGEDHTFDGRIDYDPALMPNTWHWPEGQNS